MEEHVEEGCGSEEGEGEDHDAGEVGVALRDHELADAAAQLRVLLAQVLELALGHAPPHCAGACTAFSRLCVALALRTRDHCLSSCCRCTCWWCWAGAQLGLDLEEPAHLCGELGETRLGAGAPLGEGCVVARKFTRHESVDWQQEGMREKEDNEREKQRQTERESQEG